MNVRGGEQKLAYLSGKEKSFSLWLNSLRDMVIDSVEQINPNITRNQAKIITKEFLGANIKETLSKHRLFINDINPKISNAVDEVEKIYKNEKYLTSATTEFAKNDFYDEPCLRFTANPHVDNFEFGLFSPADAMTNNQTSYITDYYDMSNDYAQQKLQDWYTIKKKSIKDDYQTNHQQIDWLFEDLLNTQAKIKEYSDILYKSGKTSVQIKDYVKFGVIEAKKNNQTLQEYFIAEKNKEGLAKIILIKHVANLKKTEDKIDELIKNKEGLREIVDQEARSFLGDIEKESKDERNENVVYRPNCGATPGFDTFTDSLESRLRCLTFAGTKADKTRDKLSEFLGFQYIYANETLKANNLATIDKLGEQRYRNISKLIDYIDGESKNDYIQRINNVETTNGRNEALIKLTKFEQADIISAKNMIGKGKPIESIYLSVKDTNGDEKQANDMFYSEKGIKQMYGVLHYFGKNAFADGVFVFEEISGLKHQIKTLNKETNRYQNATYDDVIKDIDAYLIANPIGADYAETQNWKGAETRYLEVYQESLLATHKKVLDLQQSVEKYKQDTKYTDSNIAQLKAKTLDKNMHDTNLAYYFKEKPVAKPRTSLQNQKPTPQNSRPSSSKITATLPTDFVPSYSGQFVAKRGSNSASVLQNKNTIKITEQNIEEKLCKRSNSSLPKIDKSQTEKLHNRFNKYLGNIKPNTF